MKVFAIDAFLSDIRLPKSVNLALKSMEDRRMICSLTFDTKTKAFIFCDK